MELLHGGTVSYTPDTDEPVLRLPLEDRRDKVLPTSSPEEVKSVELNNDLTDEFTVDHSVVLTTISIS